MTPETRSPDVPAAVRRAFALWTVALALQVILTVVGLFGAVPRDRLFDTAGPFGLLTVLDIVLTVALFALIALCVVKMRAGRNWARGLLLFFGVVFAYGLRHIDDPVPDAVDLVARVLHVSSSLLAVAAVVLSYLPASKPHFDAT